MSTKLAIDAIDTNGNVRHSIEHVKELAASIREVGLIQPIVVKQAEDGYSLVAGHRRLAAVAELGWTEIPAYVIESDAAVKLQQLTENVQRDNLTGLEEAQALFELKEEGHTNKQIEAATGIKSKQITKRRKLATLTPAQFAAVENRELDEQLELAELASKPDVLDDVMVLLDHAPNTRIGWAVQQAERQRRNAEMWDKLEPKLEKLRAAGVEVIGTRDEPAGYSDVSGRWSRLGDKYNDEKGLDIKAHATESCHVMVVSTGYDSKPEVSAYCKSPSRHLPRGASDLEFEDAEARAERRATETQDRKRERKLREARRNVLSEQVSAIAKKPMSQVLPVLAQQLIKRSWAEANKEAVRLLGLELKKSEYHNGYVPEEQLLELGGSFVRQAVATTLAGLVPHGTINGTEPAIQLLELVDVDFTAEVEAEVTRLLDG